MITFITSTEYQAFVGCSPSDLPSDWSRVAQRASELIYEAAFMNWTIPATTAEVPTAIKDATCAQVEYWLEEVGEGLDRLQPSSDTYTNVGGVIMNRQPKVLAPRAKRFLFMEGYLNRDVYPTGLKETYLTNDGEPV